MKGIPAHLETWLLVINEDWKGRKMLSIHSDELATKWGCFFSSQEHMISIILKYFWKAYRIPSNFWSNNLYICTHQHMSLEALPLLWLSLALHLGEEIRIIPGMCAMWTGVLWILLPHTRSDLLWNNYEGLDLGQCFLWLASHFYGCTFSFLRYAE